MCKDYIIALKVIKQLDTQCIRIVKKGDHRTDVF